MAMRFVSVFREQPISLDHKLGWKGIAVFTMDQQVRDDLAQDVATQGYPLHSFEIEGIVQVFFSEGDQSVVAVQ